MDDCDSRYEKIENGNCVQDPNKPPKPDDGTGPDRKYPHGDPEGGTTRTTHRPDPNHPDGNGGCPANSAYNFREGACDCVCYENCGPRSQNPKFYLTAPPSYDKCYRPYEYSDTSVFAEYETAPTSHTRPDGTSISRRVHHKYRISLNHKNSRNSEPEEDRETAKKRIAKNFCLTRYCEGTRVCSGLPGL